MPTDLEYGVGAALAGGFALLLFGERKRASIDGIVNTSTGQPVGCVAIRLDGKVVGLVAPTGQFLISNLQPGDHVIRLESDQWSPSEQLVRTQGGVLAEATFNLQPQPTSVVPATALTV